MLDQYIMNCLKENDQQLQELREKLAAFQREEESCHHMIKKLREREDVGRELFSPRGANDTTRDKVSDIRKQIDEINLQQAKIEDAIREKEEEVKKYQDMLVEIKNRSSEKYQIKQLKKEPPVLNEKEEFKNILSRVDKCLQFIDTESNRCKNELNNLKYYLKAILSEK